MIDVHHVPKPVALNTKTLHTRYTCHRSVVGYVQGMSHVAAMLLLNMGVEEAFVCMINLLDR